jgi:hypothetical protein
VQYFAKCLKLNFATTPFFYLGGYGDLELLGFLWILLVVVAVLHDVDKASHVLHRKKINYNKDDKTPVQSSGIPAPF